MIRICRTCKVEYEGAPGSTLCPACVKAQKSTTICTRVCRTCSAEFPGGPRAWYCPDCREQRKKKQTLDYHRCKAAGKTRPIGSEDICIICGKPYIVNSGRQRYCPECAPGAWAEADRQQGRAWYAANADPDARRELRQAHTAKLLCVVCGKSYIPIDASKTCSKACSTELARRNAANWESVHKSQRNAYRRERRKQQKED